MKQKWLIVFGAIIFILIAAVGAYLYYLYLAPHTVRGRVVDASGQGISGVNVRALQRGWGLADGGEVIWDKEYIYPTTTDADGNFAITYSRGGESVNLQAYRGDYATNIQSVKNVYIDFWETPTITL